MLTEKTTEQIQAEREARARRMKAEAEERAEAAKIHATKRHVVHLKTGDGAQTSDSGIQTYLDQGYIEVDTYGRPIEAKADTKAKGAK